MCIIRSINDFGVFLSCLLFCSSVFCSWKHTMEVKGERRTGQEAQLAASLPRCVPCEDEQRDQNNVRRMHVHASTARARASGVSARQATRRCRCRRQPSSPSPASSRLVVVRTARPPSCSRTGGPGMQRGTGRSKQAGMKGGAEREKGRSLAKSARSENHPISANVDEKYETLSLLLYIV